jgi:hypothetical protein
LTQKPQLTDQDIKFWGAFPPITAWLSRGLFKDAKVLEAGPGRFPFSRANVFVDSSGQDGAVKCDLNFERLPFADKEFDFVYSRHMLEDMYNPFHACRELSRVAKAGYIETPSPLAELCVGVDDASPPFRGYHHHRYLVWAHQGALHFAPKMPLVEHIQMDEHRLINELKPSPIYWNTYFLWTDNITVVHHHDPTPTIYGRVLTDAVNQSQKSSFAFWTHHKIPVEYEGIIYVSKQQGAA